MDVGEYAMANVVEHVGRAGLGAAPPTRGSDRGGRGRGRGRGGGRGGGRGRGRGTSLAVTNQTHVPFDYNSLRKPKKLPSATDSADPSVPPPRAEPNGRNAPRFNPGEDNEEDNEDDEEEEDDDDDDDDDDEDEDDEDDEDESEEDLPIEPHKSYSNKHIEHRRKLEGLVLNEFDIVVTNKKYDFDRAMRHINPLRRPIVFVPSSGAHEQRAKPEEEAREEMTPAEASEMDEVDRLAAEAIAMSKESLPAASNPFGEDSGFLSSSTPFDAPTESESVALSATADDVAMPEATVESAEAPAESVEVPVERVDAPAKSVEMPLESADALAKSVEMPIESTEALAESDTPNEAWFLDTTPDVPPDAPVENVVTPKESWFMDTTPDVLPEKERAAASTADVPMRVDAPQAAAAVTKSVDVVMPPKQKAAPEPDSDSDDVIEAIPLPGERLPPKPRNRRAKKKKPFARTDSDIEWGSDGPPVDTEDNFMSFQISEQLLQSNRKPLSEQEAILADWMENAMLQSGGDDEEEEEAPMISDPYGEQLTLEDIAVDAQRREDQTWYSSEGEDDDEDDDDDDDDDDEDDDEDEEGDNDDDVEIEFSGDDLDNYSYGELEDGAAESDFGLDAESHAILLESLGSPDMNLGLPNWNGQAKRKGKTLFDQIVNGDFSEASDTNLGKIARKNRTKPQFDGDSLWAEELQQQWEKDRSSKAAKKRARAEARHTAALNPFPNTHGLSKRTQKVLKRTEKKERRANLKALADDDGPVNGDIVAPPDSFSSISLMIDEFLLDEGKTTLSLPPMLKHDRAMVHNMADAYALKSKSRGKGKERFPILYKTSKTGSRVDRSRIRRLERTPFGRMDDAKFDRAQTKGHVRINAPEVAPRNREGAQVGSNAKRITEDNIGHRLLLSMGWQSGSGLGQSSGIAEPVTATIKVTRSGLGL